MATSEGPWQELTTGVYRATCEPASVNIGLVVGTERALLVDTGSTPAQGRRLAASARELLATARADNSAPRSLDHVVVTHAHYDHYFGLAGVQGDGVTGIGHETLALPTDDDPVLAELGLAVDALVLPNSPLSIVRAVDLGDRRVEIVYVGPAHSESDLVVLVPDANVIFCGDILEMGADPHFGADSAPGHWPMALDTVIGSGNDDTIFVPGHGDPCGRADVIEQRTQVAMVYGQAEQLVRDGVKLPQALDALTTPVLADGRPHPGACAWPWPFSTETIAQALPVVYAELAAQGVEPRTRLPLIS